MVGNAAEEGLLTQIGNPSHLDPGRIAVPAGFVSGIVTFLSLGWPFGVGGRFVVATLVCVTVGLVVWRWLHRREQDGATRAMAERREMKRAETQRKIAAMKKRAT